MDFSDQHFEHYLDLVNDQQLWPAFRHIYHFYRLTQDYLALRKWQLQDFPIADPDLEVELESLKNEILKVFPS